jgi:hypothetical protein
MWWREALRRIVDSGGTKASLAAVLSVAGLLFVVGLRLPPATMAAWVLVAVAVASAARVALQPYFVAFARRPWSIRARACVPVVALVVLTFLYLEPAYTAPEGWLLDQDNSVHLERARLFFDALREHRLPLWTHLSQGGEPLVDFYGWLGNFLPLIFRAVTFGKVSFERAYQMGVASLFTFTALATYALCRRFARRWIAFSVSLLTVIGGHYFAAFPSSPFWSWHLLWGVWPALLALLFAVTATAKAVDVARRGRTFDVVAAVLLSTAACLSHGFGLFSLVLLQGALGVAVVFYRPYRRRLVPFLFAVGIGPCLSAFWWMPSQTALAAYGLRFTTRIADATASFEVLIGQLTPYGLTFAAVASFLVLMRGDRLLRAIAAVGLGGILLDASPILADLDLVRGDTGRSIPWTRLTFVFLFTASAAAAGLLESVARRKRPPPSASFSAIAPRALVAALAVLLFVPTLGRTIREGRERLLAGKPDRYFTEKESFDRLAWALAERRKREPPFRVHFVPRTDAERTLSLAVASGVPVLHTEYAGPMFLKNRMQHATAEEERAWGARYVVTSHGDKRQAPWVLDAELGAFDLWRDPTNPGIVQTSGPVHVDAPVFRDDEIRLQVSGAPPEGADVRLAIGFYPRFRAWMNKQPIAVRETPSLPKSRSMQMILHVTNGEVVLRPTLRLPGSSFARFVSDVGIVLLLAFLAARTFPSRAAVARAWLAKRTERVRTLAYGRVHRHALQAACAVLAVAVVVRLVKAPPRPSTLELHSLYGNLHAVQRADRKAKLTTHCGRSGLTRDWSCPSTDEKFPGRIAGVVSVNLFEAPGSPGWATGVPNTGFTIDERQGEADWEIQLDGTCQRFLHPHVNGSGTPVVLQLLVGDRLFPILWTSVSTIDLHGVPAAPAVLRLGFTGATTVSLSFDCDDSPEDPKPDDRTPP